jgi:drug/metabolite transporter (DMT)-like permease
MAFAGILLLAFVATFKSKQLKIKSAHIPTFIMLGLMNIYLANIFEIWAINQTFSSKVCLIYSLSPFLAALVAFIVLRETLSKKKWVGMCLGFIGLLPILYSKSETEIISGTIGMFSNAELFTVGAVFCSVYGWILLKKIISEYKYSPLVASGFSMTLGGALALGHSYLSGESWQPFPVTSVQPFILNSLAMCLISNMICYNLYGYLLKRFTATFMSFAGLVTPLFASLFGFIFLGETITWHFFAAMILFSSGLTIFLQEEIGREEWFKNKLATES